MFIIVHALGNASDAEVVKDLDSDEGSGNMMFLSRPEAEWFAAQNLAGKWVVVEFA